MRDLIFRRVQRVQGERGAIGVLVAILLGVGVLFGMGALVIDVGQLYQNRAELQNGADAAALAVAKSCVQGTCTPSIATSYADANASSLTGGTAFVNMVCVNGSVTFGTGTCTDKHCPANPSVGTKYVDIETSTELSNGSHLLPPVFARTLAGNGNYQGTTVYACAQAEWGAPLTANTAGITMSFCSWSQATSNGTSYAQYPPDPGSSPVVIDFHDPGGKESDSACPGNPAGQTAPGNFGWTADPNGDCELTASDFTDNSGSYTYDGNTGNNTPSDCQTLLSTAQSNQQLLYVPVYATYGCQGSNGTYTLQGLAAFALTGYNFGNKFQVADRITGKVPCDTGGVTCVSGYFVQGLIPDPGILGGTNLGVGGIKLTG
jgi:Putative Flp pilus-assembly TadE/G-like